MSAGDESKEAIWGKSFSVVTDSYRYDWKDNMLVGDGGQVISAIFSLVFLAVRCLKSVYICLGVIVSCS